jgi:hypothetical protein
MLTEAERDKVHDGVAGLLRAMAAEAAADSPEAVAEMLVVVLSTATGSAQRYLGDGLARYLIERQLALIGESPQPLH